MDEHTIDLANRAEHAAGHLGPGDADLDAAFDRIRIGLDESRAFSAELDAFLAGGGFATPEILFATEHLARAQLATYPFLARVEQSLRRDQDTYGRGLDVVMISELRKGALSLCTDLHRQLGEAYRAILGEEARA